MRNLKATGNLPDKTEQLNMRLVIVMLAIGSAVILVSFASGKEWKASDFIYDIGVAVVTAGLIDSFLKVLLEAYTARQERRLAEFIRQTNDLSAEMTRMTDEINQRVQAINLESMQADLAGIAHSVNAIQMQLFDQALNRPPDDAPGPA